MKTIAFFIGLFIPILLSNSFSQEKYFRAIENDNLKLFYKELDKGSDINFQRKKDSLSPLMLASSLGKEEFVKILIENKANIDLNDINQNTALLYALINNHIDIASILISNGANITVKNKNGFSTLHCCCFHNNTNNKQMHDYQMKIINDIISSDVPVNDTNNVGVTPLIFACQEGDLEIVKLLFQNDADIHRKAQSGFTSLGQAAQKGHLDIVKFLLEKGADINIICQGKLTPLILSIYNKNFKTSEYLMSQNADLEYISPDGLSALKASIIVSNRNFVEIISDKIDLAIDLDTEYDNELMASSIAFSNDNSILLIMVKNEVNYKKALENKNLADSFSYDSVKSKFYISQEIDFLEKSYKCYANREKEYRKQAGIIEAKNALKVGVSLLSYGLSATLPYYYYVASPGKLEDPTLLYKIADRYKAQMAVLQGTINIEKQKY